MPITADDGDAVPAHRRPAADRGWGDHDVPPPEDRGVYAIDHVDGDVWRWRLDADGTVERTVDAAYTPTCHVASTEANLAELESHLSRRSRVASTGLVQRRTRWRREPERVLRVAVDRPATVRDVAGEVRGYGDPGEYELFNVDFTREYRYCLERGVDPAPPPGVTPSALAVRLDRKHLTDGDVARLHIDGERAADTEAGALRRLRAALDDRDPDVLVVSHAALVPLLHDRADALDVDRGGERFHVGRIAEPRYQELAGASSFHSYGRLVSSPARYNVPGRAVIDESNGFLWGEANVHGLLDLVARSRKPLQELGWASIGNVFTSLQVREAFRRGVLVPWKSWRHEFFKPMATLHDSDRGGHILAPDVGMHEDVYECDFAALYPNIMVTRNVSPDVIQCDCHGDRADVPGLGYNVCDDEGYLRDVLRPLIADRQAMKRRLATLEDGGNAPRAAAGDGGGDGDGLDAAADRLRGPVEAMKWIMVSCFGYQGFSNAKFGRIECHEAINAHAREILLDAKDAAERRGWRVVHGIVDSLWLQPVDDDRDPIGDVCKTITADVGIPLEFERRYDWIGFVPCRGEERRGALNRYFGVGADGDVKTRGIECRQRSTPPFVADAQRRFIDVLDGTRDPGAVADAAAERIARLRGGDVAPEDLVVTRKVSKEVEDYERGGRAVAALERASTRGLDVRPGEDVRFVVVDDDADTADRVRLAFEETERYDADHYADRVLRACESVTSPLGWDERRIRREIRDADEMRLSAFE